MACAEVMLRRLGAHAISGSALRGAIEELLFGRQEIWPLAREGLITEDEAANKLLAHLDDFAEATCGKRFHDPAIDDSAKMRRAMFG